MKEQIDLNPLGGIINFDRTLLNPCFYCARIRVAAPAVFPFYGGFNPRLAFYLCSIWFPVVSVFLLQSLFAEKGKHVKRQIPGGFSSLPVPPNYFFFPCCAFFHYPKSSP
eukprot:FR736975.1.p1 GENE.FR736975.1~~FR736975.1.p1  ORF type:complete len:110 (+),score=13.01 FR736975.1:693-1022(+)